jgi:hypothetical protein
MDSQSFSPLPCSGGLLSIAINRRADLEFRTEKDHSLKECLDYLYQYFGFGPFTVDRITEFERSHARRTGLPVDDLVNLRSSFRHLANSALTPGRSGQERTLQKLSQLVRDVHLLATERLRDFDDQQMLDELWNLEKKFQSNQNYEAQAMDIYMDFARWRKDKTGLSIVASRVRRIVTWLNDDKAPDAAELRDRVINTSSEASRWMEDVFSAFLMRHVSLERFSSSYLNAWVDQGEKTVRGDLEGVNQPLSRRPDFRGSILEEKVMNQAQDFWANSPSKNFEIITHQMQAQHRSDSGRRADFTSPAQVEMDLKAGSRGLEARFTLPGHVFTRTPELQIKVMEFVGREFSKVELSISASTSPRPSIVVTAHSVGSDVFGKVAFAVLQMLNKECS